MIGLEQGGGNASLPERFPLGQIMATPAALRVLDDSDIADALRRHAAGDWGDVCADDWTANEEALKGGSRILSSYKSAKGVKFWVITEWDRSLTTVLLPDDY